MYTPVKSCLTYITDSDSKLSLNTIKHETHSFTTPFSDKLKTMCVQYQDSRDSKPIKINSWPKAEKLVFPKTEVEPVILRSLLNPVKVESIESQIVTTNLVPSVKEEGIDPIDKFKDQRANNEKCSNGSNPNLTSKTYNSGGVQLNDYSRAKSTINILKSHEKMHFNRQDNFSCDICGKCLASKRSLEGHLHLHFPTNEFNCDFCGKLFSTQYQLMKHKYNHQKRYECKICLKSYVTKYHLAKHKIQHQPGGLPKEHLCEICGYQSDNLGHLKYHISNVHLHKKRYICDICGRGYLNSHKFTSHMATHSEDKRFICEVCDGCFKRRVDVKHHITRVHPKTMGLQKAKLHCPLCEKVYTTKDGFMKHKFTSHMATHSKGKRFICALCDRCFKRRLDVKHHITRVHPKTMGLQKSKLHCSLCEKVYTTKEGLRKHMVRHSGERKFVCDLCGKRFMHRFDLSKHKKSSIHNGK